ncbi:MAG TPA: sulfatase-like hydrolase/transferase, partial [Candidatus Competibacteraceae bacterium]|nr:sulfatase-like hydrolase/transferase [Candidatus Competibacteraceae bacterium]
MLSLTLMVIIISFATGIAQAADQGPRHHAKGQYETVTATYTAVEGDELIAIGERFEVPVESLKAQNKLTSDEVKVGQKLVVAAGAPEAEPASAPQITGTLGSASATTTIPGNQLPPPDPKFGGVIKERASESTPWWPPRVVPPKKAPNVLLIMTDDDGFGSPSTFGGVIPTPALDRIANSGLRYTNFHSTSLCSPTRAAIITGRNHH